MPIQNDADLKASIKGELFLGLKDHWPGRPPPFDVRIDPDRKVVGIISLAKYGKAGPWEIKVIDLAYRGKALLAYVARKMAFDWAESLGQTPVEELAALTKRAMILRTREGEFDG